MPTTQSQLSITALTEAVKSRLAEELGPGPYTYEVTLVRDAGDDPCIYVLAVYKDGTCGYVANEQMVALLKAVLDNQPAPPL